MERFSVTVPVTPGKVIHGEVAIPLVHESDILRLVRDMKFIEYVGYMNTNVILHKIEVFDITWASYALQSALLEITFTVNGERKTSKVFLHGDSVAVLVVIIDEDTGIKYGLYTEEVHIAAGGMRGQLVSGVVDSGVQTQREVVLKALQEKFPALSFAISDIHPLGPGHYSSMAVLSKRVDYYYIEKVLPHEQIILLHSTDDNLEEDESFGAHICLLSDLLRNTLRDPNAEIALQRWLALTDKSL